MKNKKVKTASLEAVHTNVWNKALCAVALFGASIGMVTAQTVSTLDSTKTKKLETVVISNSRADNKTPLTTTTLGRAKLNEQKIAISLPYMLELEPSVVTTSENGMAGQASMRIRGVDATRINVNINGITLNDAESHSVFWYNIPNLGGMAQSVQLQRGVGASNGGSAAFGGAMNLQTLNTSSRPYGGAELSWGSYNTRQYGFSAGTGLTKKGLSFDVAYSGLTSDGFRRGGQSDQQSLFLNAGWYTDRSLLKAVVIVGEQHSGITWTGASAEDLDKDPTYNPRGAYYDTCGNVFYYDNETDNYKQQHYQLYYSYLLSDKWNVNAVVNYTHGFGYTESYKNDKKPKSFGMASLMPAVAKGDFIVNKDMDNDAYTANFSARYKDDNLTLNFGANYLYYTGEHYGEVVWADQYDGVSRDNPFDDWYSNTGVKHDATLFAKLNYDFSSRFNLYADMQMRRVSYSLHGVDDDYGQIDYDTNYLFFNPKIGLNYRMDDDQRLYAVAGVSSREPARSDIKEAIYYGKTMKPENMLDIEMGYLLKKQNFTANLNLFAMFYKNQLVANGLQTDSGYDLMENVDNSKRLGLEMVAGYRIDRHFSIDGNLTLSSNTIKNYTADIIASDWSASKTVDFGATKLAFSPSVVGAAMFTYRPVEACKLQLIGKYVGEQYADNTSRKESLLDDYFLLNARFSYTFNISHHSQLECQLSLNNILDASYRTNAWCGVSYDPVDGSLTTVRSYFQQPGRNLMIRIAYNF